MKRAWTTCKSAITYWPCQKRLGATPSFMGLLLDNGIPYARLSLLKKAGTPEFLLLPKEHQEATALGEGLRLAGAQDVPSHLRQLAVQPA